MRNRLQKTRVNSEKSIRTLGWRGGGEDGVEEGLEPR